MAYLKSYRLWLFALIILSPALGKWLFAEPKGTANQVYVVPPSGNPLPRFSSVNLASSAAVGSSILPRGNGGTGVTTFPTNQILYGAGSSSFEGSAEFLTSHTSPDYYLDVFTNSVSKWAGIRLGASSASSITGMAMGCAGDSYSAGDTGLGAVAGYCTMQLTGTGTGFRLGTGSGYMLNIDTSSASGDTKLGNANLILNARAPGTSGNYTTRFVAGVAGMSSNIDLTLPLAAGTLSTKELNETITGTRTFSNTVTVTGLSGLISAATGVLGSAVLSSGNIYVGDGSNVPTSRAMSGDVTINNTGVTAIGSSKVTSSMIVDGTIADADISSSAAITRSKIVAGTANRIVVNGGDGLLNAADAQTNKGILRSDSSGLPVSNGNLLFDPAVGGGATKYLYVAHTASSNNIYMGMTADTSGVIGTSAGTLYLGGGGNSTLDLAADAKFNIQAKFLDGSTGAPGISFINAAATGFTRPTTNKMAACIEGVEVQRYYADSSSVYGFVIGGTTFTSGNANVLLGRNSTQGYMQLSNTQTGNTEVAYFYNANGNVGSISTNGSATQFNTSSDYRLKKNFTPVNGALDKINSVDVYNYEWLMPGDNTPQVGMKAHELQAVAPYAVTGSKDAVDGNGAPKYQQVDYSKLVPILWQAVKDLDAKLNKICTKQPALCE